jgi:predicted Zn-dependent protease
MLGEAYGQTYQARLAVHELMTYLTLLGQQGLPPTPILLHELVIVQRQRGDLASALYYARQLEQAAPKQVELRLERLEIEVVATDGRHDEKAAARLAELRQELQDVRAKVGDSPGLTILEAQTWVNAGNPKRAEELLRQTAATDKTPQSRMELIAFLVQQGAGRRGDALDQCRQLIKEHADLAGGYKALATLQEEQGNAQQARTTLTDGVAAAAAADKRGLEVELALFDLRHEKRPEALARLEKLRQQDKQDVRLRSLMLEMADAAGDRAWAESLVEEIKAVQGDGGLLWRYYRARLLMNDSNWRDKREEIGSLLQACRMIDPGLAAAVLLLGELDEREGQVDQAALTYETALRDNPGSMELAGKLIRLLEGQKRFAEVADVLDSLVGADPRRVADLRIHIALGGGDTAAAMDELRRRIAADPKDATSRVSLAQLLYAQRQDVDGALELLEQARRIDPQSLLPAAAQISILRSSGRGEEVLPLLDREVARQDTFESRLLRGTYLARIGRNDLADADFATLPERNDQGDGQLKQAQHYLATWRVAQAQGVLADGVTRYPANTALKEQSIRLLLGSPQAQRRQEGLAMLEKLLAAHPENPDLRVMQARALLVQGDPAAVQKAEAIARDMARRFPLLIDAHLALAQVLAQRGDFAEMQQVLVEALRSNSDSIPLLLQLAQAQDELGNTTAARETVSQAIAAAPLFGPARAFGVQLALRHGDKAYLADQLSSLQDALASAPEDEQLQLTQAVALEQLGRPDAAVAALEAFIKNGPAGARSFNVYLMLCDLHRQAGRLEKAQQCYQSACAAAGDERQLLSERLMLLGAQGQYDQVVEAINALPADWTVDERTVQTAATVLDASGRPEYRQAARQWCLQLAKSAESLPVRYRLANLIYSDGDTETALALYEDLYRQAPDHPNVLNDLAWILAHQKGDEPVARAIELSTKAVMINPSDGHLRHTRAFALSASRRQEDWAEGAQEYERFLGLVRESPSQQALGQAEMGLLLVRLNLKDQARSALTEAVKLDAQGAKLSQALRQQVQDALAGLK